MVQSLKSTSKVMARVRKEREIKRSRITVIGEGLTERWYFEHLRTIKGYRYDCKPRFFAHQSYEEMEKLTWVSDLCADERLKEACRRASLLGPGNDAYSEIYKAIELFE